MATKKDFKKNITDDKLKNDDIILPEILENIIDEITYNVFKDIKSEKNNSDDGVVKEKEDVFLPDDNLESDLKKLADDIVGLLITENKMSNNTKYERFPNNFKQMGDMKPGMPGYNDAVRAYNKDVRAYNKGTLHPEPQYASDEEIEALMDINIPEEKSTPKDENWNSLDELFLDNLNNVFNYMSSCEEYYGYKKEFDVEFLGKTNLDKSAYYISQDINQYKNALEMYIPNRTALYVLKSVYNKHKLNNHTIELLEDFFKCIINDTSSELRGCIKNSHFSWENTKPKLKKCEANCNVVMISLGKFKFDFYYKYSSEFDDLIKESLKKK